MCRYSIYIYILICIYICLYILYLCRHINASVSLNIYIYIYVYIHPLCCQPWHEAPPTQQQTLALEEEGWVGVAMWGGMWLRGVGWSAGGQSTLSPFNDREQACTRFIESCANRNNGMYAGFYTSICLGRTGAVLEENCRHHHVADRGRQVQSGEPAVVAEVDDRLGLEHSKLEATITTKTLSSSSSSSSSSAASST
jgi:hypothetical protein